MTIVSAATRRAPRLRPGVDVLVVLVVCVVVRLGYVVEGGPPINGDQDAAGLMVGRILHGQTFWFFAGQHYGAPFEQYLQAAGYALFRLPQTIMTLRLTDVALSCVTCLLVLAVGRRALAGRIPAVTAAMFFAIGPWFNLSAGSTSQGFYVAAQTLATACVYFALRWREAPRSTAWAIAFGGCAGGALWCTLTSVYLIVPAALWVLLGRPGRRATLLAIGSVLVAAGPVVVQLAVSGRLPVPDTDTHPIGVAQRLVNVVDPLTREFFGVTYAHTRGGLVLPAQLAVLFVALAAYVVGAVRVGHRLRRDGLMAVRFVDLLLLVPVLALGLHLLSPSAAYTGTPRYLLLAYPALAWALGAALPHRNGRRTVLAASLVLGLTVVLGGALVLRPDQHVDRPPAADLSATIRLLVDRHETRVYADYWTALPIEYTSHDAVVAAVYSGVDRFPDDFATVRRSGAVVYVASTGDGTFDTLRAALTRHAVVGRVTAIGTLRVVDDLPPNDTPGRLLG